MTFLWNLREVARSAYVSYPIPFITTLLIVGGLCLIGAARLFEGAERAILLGIGCLAITAANATAVWAVFFKPELVKHDGFRFLDKSSQGGLRLGSPPANGVSLLNEMRFSVWRFGVGVVGCPSVAHPTSS